MFDLLSTILSDAAALPLLMNYPRVIHAPALTQATLSLVTSQVRCLRSKKMSCFFVVVFFSKFVSAYCNDGNALYLYPRSLLYTLKPLQVFREHQSSNPWGFIKQKAVFKWNETVFHFHFLHFSFSSARSVSKHRCPAQVCQDHRPSEQSLHLSPCCTLCNSIFLS